MPDFFLHNFRSFAFEIVWHSLPNQQPHTAIFTLNPPLPPPPNVYPLSLGYLKYDQNKKKRRATTAIADLISLHK